MRTLSAFETTDDFFALRRSTVHAFHSGAATRSGIFLAARSLRIGIRRRQSAPPPADKSEYASVAHGHLRNWLDCIRSRKRPLADVEIGARSVAITILGNLAYWNGRRLRWDPKRWEFVDDPIANQWLDRERRDPWRLPVI